ncbi:O-antigen ligase family protein [Bradyrhizobium sp. HKCCYLS1011]|uniref:O-antigen ligase family protein n=1 Tax=Bradyrhizobium sp. HKCCYLS1011 TaxID=3420733 RepID=UPI003EB754C8
MKWIGLAILLAAIAPLANWLRQNPEKSPVFWSILGFLPFALSFLHLNMAFISWLSWPGHVKGAEFSVVDALAIALYLSTPRSGHPFPFRLAFGFYILVTVLSCVSSAEPTAALFYSWQLCRIFFVCVVVAQGCADQRVPIAILKGMAAGLIFEAIIATWQRLALGVVQAPGTMYQQNLLGMIVHFVDIPVFALLLSGPLSRLLTGAVPAGLALSVLTGSRATLALSLVGYALTFLLSSLRGWTPRKRKFLFSGLAALIVIVPVALLSLDKRFESQADSIAIDYDERAAFEKSAQLMLSDNPLGQGANHYVIAANLGGYNQRAGVAWSTTSEGAHVHNVYFLVAAETGYAGLIAFLILLLRPFLVAMLCGSAHPGDRRGDLLIGLGVALLTIYVHNFFEWIFVLEETQYMFAIDVGLIAGLATELGYWSRSTSTVHYLSKASRGSDRIEPTRSLYDHQLVNEP